METDHTPDSSERTMPQLQQRVHRWISQFKVGYFSPLSNFARLVEEVGELGRIINAKSGEKPAKASEDHSKAKLEEEFGDILFTVAALANQLEVDLERSVEVMFAKIEKRDAGGRYKYHEAPETSE